MRSLSQRDRRLLADLEHRALTARQGRSGPGLRIRRGRLSDFSPGCVQSYRATAGGEIDLLEVVYDPDDPEAVLALAHELGHAWDRIESPEVQDVLALNYAFKSRATIGVVLDDERRAWDWAALFLRRAGFFRRWGSWKKFVGIRDRCLDTYQRWAETFRPANGGSGGKDRPPLRLPGKKWSLVDRKWISS